MFTPSIRSFLEALFRSGSALPVKKKLKTNFRTPLAIALGASANQFAEQHEQVVGDLMQLLLTQGEAFESMGVCLDGVTRKLEAKWR